MGSMCKCRKTDNKDQESEEKYEENCKRIEELLTQLSNIENSGLSHTGIWPDRNVNIII
jgi:hypothetical protein